MGTVPVPQCVAWPCWALLSFKGCHEHDATKDAPLGCLGHETTVPRAGTGAIVFPCASLETALQRCGEDFKCNFTLLLQVNKHSSVRGPAAPQAAPANSCLSTQIIGMNRPPSTRAVWKGHSLHSSHKSVLRVTSPSTGLKDRDLF